MRAIKTPIKGLIIFELEIFEDSRGSFCETFNREKILRALDEILDDSSTDREVFEKISSFEIVQNNVSVNRKYATRGIHAEPWDKYISPLNGEFFGAWVDLRDGEDFGELYTAKIKKGQAIFVPKGVGNSFQSLTEDLVYSYLVNDHWSEEAKSEYEFVNLMDGDLDIQWPLLPLLQQMTSEADKNHPFLKELKEKLRGEEND